MPRVFKRIMEDLNNYLKDNVNAWELDANGNWYAVQPKDTETPFSAQDFLLNKINKKGSKQPKNFSHSLHPIHSRLGLAISIGSYTR